MTMRHGGLAALGSRTLTTEAFAVEVFLQLGCESALVLGSIDALADMIRSRRRLRSIGHRR